MTADWNAKALRNGLTSEQGRLLKSIQCGYPFDAPVELEKLKSKGLVADGRCTPLGLAVLRLKR